MNSLSREPNVIYVGRKPPMNYVLGIITSFSGSNTKLREASGFREESFEVG